MTAATLKELDHRARELEDRPVVRKSGPWGNRFVISSKAVIGEVAFKASIISEWVQVAGRRAQREPRLSGTEAVTAALQELLECSGDGSIFGFWGNVVSARPLTEAERALAVELVDYDIVSHGVGNATDCGPWIDWEDWTQ